VVICLEQGADLHRAQLMSLPLTVSCFSKIQICFTFLVPAHPGSLGQRTVKQMCVCVCMCVCVRACVRACVCFNHFYTLSLSLSLPNHNPNFLSSSFNHYTLLFHLLCYIILCVCESMSSLVSIRIITVY